LCPLPCFYDILSYVRSTLDTKSHAKHQEYLHIQTPPSTSEISAPKNLPYAAVCLSGMLLEDLLEFLEQGLGEDANRRGSSLPATNRDIGE